MNHLNSVELQKWKPRRPSPEVYQRIFGKVAESDMAFHLRDLTRWLVPVFGCFLLVMGSLSNHLMLRGENEFVLPPLSEDMTVSILPGAKSHSGVNCYPAKSYEMAFGTRVSNGSVSTATSLLISYTNKLIQ